MQRPRTVLGHPGRRLREREHADDRPGDVGGGLARRKEGRRGRRRAREVGTAKVAGGSRGLRLGRKSRGGDATALEVARDIIEFARLLLSLKAEEREQPAEAGTTSESESSEPWPEEGKLLQAVIEKERAGYDEAYWEAERAAWSRLEGLEVGRHEAQGDRKGPRGRAVDGQANGGKAAQGAKDQGGRKGGRGRGRGGGRNQRRGAAPSASR